MRRFPEYVKKRLPAAGKSAIVIKTLKEGCLNTVCESARCPNRTECFSMGTAAFIILGNLCTRRGRFCAVLKGTPAPPDPREPENLA